MQIFFFFFCFFLLITSLPLTLIGKEQSNSIKALELIRRQQYDAAINILEEVLELNSNDKEALAYMGAAQLYSEMDIDKARKWYERSLVEGGEAIFWVTYSRENIVLGGNFEDDSRGWLHIRKGEIEFSQVDGKSMSSLKFSSSEIKEIKQNRTSKRMFHIKSGDKTHNFRPRSNTEDETLLIIILYQKFSKQ